jgi:hypothetical protein
MHVVNASIGDQKASTVGLRWAWLTACATAEAIHGAELVVEGMGHDPPRGLKSQLAVRVAEFVWRVEDRASQPSTRPK